MSDKNPAKDFCYDVIMDSDAYENLLPKSNSSDQCADIHFSAGVEFGCQKAWDHQRKEIDELKGVLAEIMNLLDKEILVRNIDNDHKDDWSLRMLELVTILKKADTLSKEK